MEAVKLSAASRTSTGKGTARSLRRTGRVPAVIYGHGRDPQPIDVEASAVSRLLDQIGGETVLIDVAIDGAAPVKAVVREVQRNPVRRSDVIHLDLYAVVADEPIQVDVPVHIVGNADGVRNQGGVLDHHLHRLTVRCLPANIPEHIEIDVTPLQVGQAIHIHEIKVPNAELMHDANVAVVSVLAGRVEDSSAAASGEAEPEVIKKGKAEEAEADAGE
jgi:large subunit ribosomal protein L25